MLTQRQRFFIDAYLLCGNGTHAAIQAGYSDRSARSYASELIRKPEVVAELARRRAEVRRGANGIAIRMAEDMAAMAFASMDDLFHADGRWKRIEELDPETRRAIKVIRKPPKVRANERWPTTPFVLYDKVDSLDLLGAHLGHFPQRRGRPRKGIRSGGGSFGQAMVPHAPKPKPEDDGAPPTD